MQDEQALAGLQKRLFILAAGLAFAFILAIFRLVSVSTRDHAVFQRYADSLQRREYRALAGRGNFRDRNDDVLVSSALWYRLYIDPSKLQGDPSWVFELAEHYFHKPHSFVVKKLEGKKIFTLDWFASEEVKNEVLSRFGRDATGRRREALRVAGPTYGRKYAAGAVALQVVGYLNADGKPQAGLELSLNSFLEPHLSSTAGALRSADGMLLPFASGGPAFATPGDDLVLTLDGGLQRTAQRLVQETGERTKADFVLLLALDPRTGEILSWAQWPGFDPLRRETMLPIKKDDELDPHSIDPTRNYALDWTWEPGSFVKPLLIASALQEGVITPQSVFVCRGSWSPDGKNVVTCYHHEAHGALTPAGIIAHSCNVGAAQIATKMGAKRLLKWYRRFCLDEAPAMDAGVGVVGRVGGRKLYPLDIATLGFGQGQLRTTPLQLASALAGLANGGVIMQPYVVKAVLTPEGRLLQEFAPRRRAATVDPSIAKTVLHMMRTTITSGTGRHLDLPGYEVCGKTSTAEVSLPGKGYLEDDYHRIVGFFGVLPEHTPRLAVLVLVKYPKVANPSGAGLAGPVFKEFAQEAVHYLRLVPRTSQ